MPFSEFRQHFGGICRSLEQARLGDRLGQAYLIVGDHVESLVQFGRALAQTAACISPNADGSACGNCRICRHFQTHSYTELYEVHPESKSRIIKIDAMRDFERNIGLAAAPDHLKIGMVLEADCMGEEAQNAFLKTLEEPPARTVLILLTTQPRKLLPTIRSRCQTVLLLRNKKDYRIAAEQGLFQLLAKLHPGAGAKVALEVSYEIGQLLKKFQQLAEQTVEETWDSGWEYAAEDNRSMQKQLQELKKVRAESEYMRLREEMLDALQAWFLQEYLRAEGVRRELLPHPEMLEGAAGETPVQFTVEEADEAISQVQEFCSCLKANVDETLALEVVCLQICAVRPRTPGRK